MTGGNRRGIPDSIRATSDVTPAAAGGALKGLAVPLVVAFNGFTIRRLPAPVDLEDDASGRGRRARTGRPGAR